MRAQSDVVLFYNRCGTTEQWIKEGKQAADWTRLSCDRFRANEVRLHMSVLVYTSTNLWKRLSLLGKIEAEFTHRVIFPGHIGRPGSASGTVTC